MKRVLSVLLTLCLIVGLLPVLALAADTRDDVEISTVQLQSIKMPTAGSAPSFGAQVVDGAKYHVYLEQWVEVGGENYVTSSAFFNRDEDKIIKTFEAGKQYRYSVWVKPNDTVTGSNTHYDCYFADNTGLTIGGDPVTVNSTGNESATNGGIWLYTDLVVDLPAPITETADFTKADNGASALALLGETAAWNAGTKTLTLQGLNFATGAATALKLPAGATINIPAGKTAAIKSTCATADSYGIYAAGDLTITGGGELFVNGADGANKYSHGLYVASNATLTIDGPNVTFTGGKAGADSYGVCASSATVWVKSGKLTAQSGGDARETCVEGATYGRIGSYGLYARNLIVAGGTVEAHACPVEAWSTAQARGVDVNQVIVTGGTLQVSAGAAHTTGSRYTTSADSESIGMLIRHGFGLYGGTVTASAGAATTAFTGSSKRTWSYGIWTYDECNTAVCGGSLTASGATVGLHSTGSNNIEFYGGSLSVTGGYDNVKNESAASFSGTSPAAITAPAAAPVLVTKLDFTGGGSIDPAVLLSIAGGTNAWNAGSKTLTLGDITVRTPDAAALVLPAGATIALTGGKTAIFAAEGEESDYATSTYRAYGIDARGDLTISGSGTLRVGSKSGILSFGASENYGMKVDGLLTVQGGDITVQSGAAEAYALSGSNALRADSCGVHCKALSVTGGKLTAVGGDAEAACQSSASTAGEAKSYGVYVGNDAISLTGGVLDATGGDAVVSATKNGTYNAASYGVYHCGFSSSGLPFTGCTVTAAAGEATGKTSHKSVGMAVNNYGGLNITGSAAVTVTGDDGGLEATAGQLTVTDSTLTATGVVGISCRDMTIGGASVVTVSGVTEGIMSGTGKLTINDGTVSVTAATPSGNSGLWYATAIRVHQFAMAGGTLTASGIAAAGDKDDKTFGLLCEYQGVGDSGPSTAELTGGTASFIGKTTAIRASGGITSSLQTIGAKEAFTSGTTTTLTQSAADTPVTFYGQPVHIAPADLGKITVKTKTYDHRTTAELVIGSGIQLLDKENSVVAGLTLTKGSATAAFADYNAGSGKTVTVSGAFGIGGTGAGNYYLVQPTLSLTGTIDPRTTVSRSFLSSYDFIKGTGAFPCAWVNGVSYSPDTARGVTSQVTEAATGSYTFGWTPAGGSAVSGKSAAETAAYLNTLADKTAVTVSFAFSGTGNYAGASLTGTVAVTVIDARAFIGNGAEATTANALTVKAAPVYGDAWAEIVKINNGIYAQIGADDTHKDRTKSHFTLDVSGKPEAGDGKAYQVLYSGTINGTTFTNAVVLSGTVDVAKKELTVKPKDLRVYVNEATPTLELDYVGLVSGDALATDAAATFVLKDSEGNWLQKEVDDGSGGTTTADITDPAEALVVAVTQTGTYRIVWTNMDTSTVTGAPLANYEVTKAAEGTLTVSVRPVYVPTPEEDAPCDGGENCISHAFADVDASKWYHDAVDYVIEQKLMNGSNGRFDPNGTLTRAMLCQILYNRAGRPASGGESGFSDVAAGKWHAAAVCWAHGSGLIDGFRDGTFRPDDAITREQLAVILWRYAGKPASNAPLDRWPDAETISSYALPAFRWAVEKGILNGKGSGTLDPQGKAERCEAAKMLMVYLEGGK